SRNVSNPPVSAAIGSNLRRSRPRRIPRLRCPRPVMQNPTPQAAVARHRRRLATFTRHEGDTHMKLGFVSAILPDLDLDHVLAFARESGFAAVEAMCWPAGRAERRYAGVTHVDAALFGRREADGILALCERHGVKLSGLGYYPNPLAADEREAAVCIEHLKKVISAAALLGVNQVNTFIGRDPVRSLD